MARRKKEEDGVIQAEPVAVAAVNAPEPEADDKPDVPLMAKLEAEVERLRQRDAARDAELSAIKAKFIGAAPEKNKHFMPKLPNEIGLKVETRSGPGMRDEAARAAYDRNFKAEHGGVLIRMNQCGANVLITDIERFPRYDMPCLCGRANHRMVKYKVQE